MLRNPALGLLAATAAILLAGCGGAQVRPQPAAVTTAAAVWHRYVQCVRDHGVPSMPDATIDDHGQASFPSSAPRVPDDVVQQCGSILDSLPPRPVATVDMAMRQQFARCMRDQGITDFPDPDSRGRFVLPPSLDQGGNLKSSSRWAQVRAAMDGPCRRYDPSGSI